MKSSKQLTIAFKSDIKKAKRYFTPESFAHPAKMHVGLLLWIIGKYSEPGETILDPMAGSGRTMLACTLGRNVILVELEEKFCKMCQDNWEQVKMRPQLGYSMGDCQIIQGDARQLEGLLVDMIVTSPPYAEAQLNVQPVIDKYPELKGKGGGLLTGLYKGHGENDGNISNLPYGEVDKIVTSPPYSDISMGGGLNTKPPREGTKDQSGRSPHSPSQRGAGGYDEHKVQDGRVSAMMDYSYTHKKHGKTDGQIARLPYGQIDKIVTSPPYEETISKHAGGSKGVKEGKFDGWLGKSQIAARTYSEDEGNIGNLKSDSYLEAMLQVYQQCYKVLKPDGLMILVTKDFIRKKQRILLSYDTICLCEQAGFELVDWHLRRLLTQSFWRTIYYKKYPQVERIDHEDILVFRKCPLKK